MKKPDKQLEVEMNGMLDLGKMPEDLLQLFCEAMLKEIESTLRQEKQNS